MEVCLRAVTREALVLVQYTILNKAFFHPTQAIKIYILLYL